MRHPLALTPLFLTEMWERYGFYILQGMLIIYMTSALHLSDTHSYIILGEFSALAYMSPILGGFLADRLLGYRNSILFGAILLCLGYAIIATLQKELLFWGLAFVITGNGFLKPNISSYLGEFYTTNDPRRDSGFTIFYMGINLGALLSTLSIGFIQSHFGWAICFACAAFGMIIAIISFVLGFNRYADYGLPVRAKENRSQLLAIFFKYRSAIVLIFLAAITASYFLLKFASIGDILQLIMGILLLGALTYAATKYETKTRNRLFALLLLIGISIIFWGVFFQAFFSVNLFIERNVYRHIFGLTIPPIMFISMEVIFILLFGLPLAALWQKLNRKKRKPPISLKFSLSLFATSIAMFLLVIATHFPMLNGQIHPYWMIGFYFALTIGEMLLSPIGLAMITELAPPKLTGLMMGVWFLALGFGGSLAGYLANEASIPHHLTNLSITNKIYGQAFFNYGLLTAFVGVLLLILTPWFKQLTSQQKEAEKDPTSPMIKESTKLNNQIASN